MGWVHSYKRYGASLALAALALQFALSFGHVHLNGSSRAAAVAVAVAHGKAVAQASRQIPAQNPSDDDDYCAICASIYLASTSFAPLPPQLPVPIGFSRVEQSFVAAFGIIAPRRVVFRSRAPPAA
jgi:hypothetical protein